LCDRLEIGMILFDQQRIAGIDVNGIGCDNPVEFNATYDPTY